MSRSREANGFGDARHREQLSCISGFKKTCVAPAAVNFPRVRRRSVFPWVNERAIYLKRMFTGLDTKVAAGKKLNPEIRRAARRWKGRHYRTAPHQTIRFSHGTLRNAYYRWVRAGRADSVLWLQLGTVTGARKAEPFVGRFLQMALCSGVDTISSAWAYLREAEWQLGGLENLSSFPSRDSFRRSIPQAQWEAIRGVHMARRQAAMALAQFNSVRSLQA